MDTDKLFERASRRKMRYQTDKGMVSTEDLWDLKLEDLNNIAKGYSRKIKEEKEEDFLKEKTVESTVTKLAFDVVLHVLNTKVEEGRAKLNEKAKKAEKEKLLKILESKEDKELENLTPEEIRARIDAL
jgi:hypothetical protein